MDALRFLEAQHDDIRTLFRQFDRADERVERRRAFLELADQLALHTTVEERRFYPVVFVGALEGALREAVEEHLAAKRVLADLLDLDVEDPQFIPKVHVLREEVEHHLLREEIELFPMVRANFTGLELAVIGEALEELTRTLQGLGAAPRNHIPEETAHAAPLG